MRGGPRNAEVPVQARWLDPSVFPQAWGASLVEGADARRLGARKGSPCVAVLWWRRCNRLVLGVLWLRRSSRACDLNWPRKGGAKYRASPSGAADVVQVNVLLARLIYYKVGDFVHVYVPITLK